MHDKDWGDIADDCVVPSQWADLNRRTGLNNEQMLAYAVLADGIYEATPKDPIPAGKKRRKNWAEARAWIEDDSTMPFSFIWCCEAMSNDSWNAGKVGPRVLKSATRIRLRLQRVVGGNAQVTAGRRMKCAYCNQGHHIKCTGELDYAERRYRCWCKRCEYRTHENSKSRRSMHLPASSPEHDLPPAEEAGNTGFQDRQGLALQNG